MRCMLCYGRKKVYKLGGGYTHVDMGAPEIQCPECKGTGVRKAVTKTPENGHGDSLMNAPLTNTEAPPKTKTKKKKKVDA